MLDYKNWNLDHSALHFVSAYIGRRSSKDKMAGVKHGWKGAGVYFIKEHDVLVYVGMSGTSVKKALYRHFHKWEDIRHSPDKNYDMPYRVSRTVYDLGYAEYTVAMVFVEGRTEAMELEKRCILRHRPRDNRQKYEYFILTYNGNLAHKKEVLKDFAEEDSFSDFYITNKHLEDDSECPF